LKNSEKDAAFKKKIVSTLEAQKVEAKVEHFCKQGQKYIYLNCGADGGPCSHVFVLFDSAPHIPNRKLANISTKSPSNISTIIPEDMLD
jgi:hypothetical protein